MFTGITTVTITVLENLVPYKLHFSTTKLQMWLHLFVANLYLLLFNVQDWQAADLIKKLVTFGHF